MIAAAPTLFAGTPGAFGALPKIMTPAKPHITAKIAGRPLHPLLRPFAIGYFLAVCGCDLVYSQASIFARNDAPQFASITEWLLGAGLIMAGLTALIALIDLRGERRFRAVPDRWMFAAGGGLVIALEIANLVLRHSSGVAAIASTGLLLSLSAIAVLLATPSRNWANMYR
jgi:uncharacterized membrane protein